MLLEEMDRLVSVREGETIEKNVPHVRRNTSDRVESSKGRVKAYVALTAKCTAVENRGRAQQERII